MRRRIALVGPDHWTSYLADGLNARYPDTVLCVPLGFDEIPGAPWKTVTRLLRTRSIVRVGFPPLGLFSDLAPPSSDRKPSGLEVLERAWGPWLAHVPGKVHQLRRIGRKRRRMLAVDLVCRLAGMTWARRRYFSFWTGEAVRTTAEKIRRGEMLSSHKKDIRRSTSIACALHLAAELRQLGISAKTVPILDPLVTVPENAPDLPETMTVSSYVPDGEGEGYGLPSLLAAALAFPDVHFVIAGGSGAGLEDVPSNMRFLGWIQDTTAICACSSVLVALVARDGGERTEEALLWGRQLICSCERPYTIHVPYGDSEALVAALRDLRRQHLSGGVPLNLAGREWAIDELDADRGFERLVETLLGRSYQLHTRYSASSR